MSAPPQVLQSLVGTFVSFLQAENGQGIADLFKLGKNPHLAALKVAATVRDVVPALQSVPDMWDSVLGQHVEVVRAVTRGNSSEVFACLEEELASLLKAIRPESNWTLPVLYCVCNELKNAAVEADAQDASGKNEHMQSAGRRLNAAFGALLDRKPAHQSKKKGAMKLVNTMFEIYFRLNNYRLCAPLCKILEGPGYPSIDEYPPSHVVTYRYYTGRLHLFDGKYSEAEAELAACFESCPPQHRNRRVALMFLIPAKLMRGKIPSAAMVAKYHMSEYEGISEAVRSGNLELFNSSFAQYELLFRKRGLYLLLERLKWLVYRTLFKKTYAIVRTKGGPSVCSLAALQSALRACAVELEIEEVECIVANLIYLKLVRGYMAIQHGKTFCILSQKDPFPVLATVL